MHPLDENLKLRYNKNNFEKSGHVQNFLFKVRLL